MGWVEKNTQSFSNPGKTFAKIDPGPAIGKTLAKIDPGPAIGKTLAKIDPGPAIGKGLASVDKFVGDTIPGGWTTVGVLALAVAAPYAAPYLAGATGGAAITTAAGTEAFFAALASGASSSSAISAGMAAQTALTTAALGSAALKGATIGGALGGARSALTGEDIVKGALTGAAMGGLTGGALSGVTQALVSGGVSLEVAKTAAPMLLQAGNSIAMGQDPTTVLKNVAMSGAFDKLTGNLSNAAINKGINSTLTGIGIGAGTGAITSGIRGGDVLGGATTGAISGGISSGLDSLMAPATPAPVTDRSENWTPPEGYEFDDYLLPKQLSASAKLIADQMAEYLPDYNARLSDVTEGIETTKGAFEDAKRLQEELDGAIPGYNELREKTLGLQSTANDAFKSYKEVEDEVNQVAEQFNTAKDENQALFSKTEVKLKQAKNFEKRYLDAYSAYENNPTQMGYEALKAAERDYVSSAESYSELVGKYEVERANLENLYNTKVVPVQTKLQEAASNYSTAYQAFDTENANLTNAFETKIKPLQTAAKTATETLNTNLTKYGSDYDALNKVADKLGTNISQLDQISKGELPSGMNIPTLELGAPAANVTVAMDDPKLSGNEVPQSKAQLDEAFKKQLISDLNSGKISLSEYNKEMTDAGLQKTTSLISAGSPPNAASGPNTALYNLLSGGTGGGSLGAPNNFYTPLAFSQDGRVSSFQVPGSGDVYSVLKYNLDGTAVTAPQSKPEEITTIYLDSVTGTATPVAPATPTPVAQTEEEKRAEEERKKAEAERLKGTGGGGGTAGEQGDAAAADAAAKAAKDAADEAARLAQENIIRAGQEAENARLEEAKAKADADARARAEAMVAQEQAQAAAAQAAQEAQQAKLAQEAAAAQEAAQQQAAQEAAAQQAAQEAAAQEAAAQEAAAQEAARLAAEKAAADAALANQTNAGQGSTGTGNTGTVGSGSTGTTNVGTAGTDTTGTGAGTTGTGSGTGTVGEGGGTAGTGTGSGSGSGSGTGSGSGSGTGTGGYYGYAQQFPDIYGGIKNLSPGLTQRMDYTLTGLPNIQDTMNPMSNIPNMASGGVTSLSDAFSNNDTKGIDGSLAPGLTKAQLNYILSGMPGNNIQTKAEGGLIEGHNPTFFSEGGLSSMDNQYVNGDGDGTSDSIAAMLADGEFVIPADVVADLGNGSNEAGASILNQLLVSIRQDRHPGSDGKLPKDSKGPLAYLLDAKRKVKA